MFLRDPIKYVNEGRISVIMKPLKLRPRHQPSTFAKSKANLTSRHEF